MLHGAEGKERGRVFDSISDIALHFPGSETVPRRSRLRHTTKAAGHFICRTPLVLIAPIETLCLQHVCRA